MTEESATAAPFRFRIADITPTPADDVLAAITAALHESWPQPSAPTPTVTTIDTNWRFGQRRWRARRIPRQTWGRAG